MHTLHTTSKQRTASWRPPRTANCNHLRDTSTRPNSERNENKLDNSEPRQQGDPILPVKTLCLTSLWQTVNIPRQGTCQPSCTVRRPSLKAEGALFCPQNVAKSYLVHSTHSGLHKLQCVAWLLVPFLSFLDESPVSLETLPGG